MSQSSARLAPRPVAWPLTLQISGFSRSSWVKTMSLPSRAMRSNSSGSSTWDCIHSMSPPAQKAGPSPVSTTTSESGSRCTSVKTLRQLGVQAPVDRVALLGPVQRDGEHTPLARKAHALVTVEVDGGHVVVGARSMKRRRWRAGLPYSCSSTRMRRRQWLAPHSSVMPMPPCSCTASCASSRACGPTKALAACTATAPVRGAALQRRDRLGQHGPRFLQAQVHVHRAVHHHLVGCQRRAELPARLDVLEGQRERGFHRADGVGAGGQRGQQPAVRQSGSRQRHRLARLELQRGRAAAIEQRVGPHAQAGRAGPHREPAALARLLAFDQQQVGQVGVQHHLAAAHQLRAIRAHRPGAIGERAGGTPAALQQRGYPLRALLAARMQPDHIGGERAARNQRLVDAPGAGRLRQDGDRADAHAQAAVRLVAGHGEPAELGHLLPARSVEPALLGRQAVPGRRVVAFPAEALRRIGERPIDFIEVRGRLHRPSSILAITLRWISLLPP